jgi:hypothetical protein
VAEFLSMAHPAKVATPETAFAGLAVQVRTLPPAPPLAARVIEAELEVTVLP